ncbi:hypothetical protein SPAR57_0971 [Streptococcus pneumoniae GA19101]|nr:hypothetical protein SPAR13_1033 [Streptococcus pneumoniae GA07228]EHE72564.1 hypothetical protein SPAR59_1134 [Streptococcus pneumoniae GA19690]EHZ36028.1 hypothetical protein SPAR57_0971 [Streptococcus pneumoniae GA19101]EHZ66142.1 hypothetical protein SPAR101_0974 [Streptococcus pneumoniae GA47597]KGI30690.1 hypothetical protein BM51_1412 [Streptococcus pneumoniae]
MKTKNNPNLIHFDFQEKGFYLVNQVIQYLGNSLECYIFNIQKILNDNLRIYRYFLEGN